MTCELHPIKSAFITEYGHFADQRVKDLDKRNRFIIDDREGGGPSFGSGGIPYGWFCEMFADIEGPDLVHVTIEGPLPIGDGVVAWLSKNSVASQRKIGSGRSIYRFAVTPANVDELGTLADGLRKLIAQPTTKRANSDWYTIPRIAACLERVQRVLKQHWQVSCD